MSRKYLLSLVVVPFVLNISSSFADSRSELASELNDPLYFKVGFIETKEITDTFKSDVVAPMPEDGQNGSIFDVIGSGGIPELDQAEVVLDQIIRIGTKVVALIEKGKPVVTTNFIPASALPFGASDWRQLQGWKVPQSRVYNVSFKNMYGMNILDFSYRVVFTYGGSVNGAGQYLAQAEIQPASLSVLWGFKFDVTADVAQVVNAGDKTNPVAAMRLDMKYSLKPVIPVQETIETATFFLQGDGLFSNLTSGNMPR